MLANLTVSIISEYLVYGISLGLAAGFAPGPLLALVISETIKGDKINGILIALSPLITDLPIILLSIYMLKFLQSSDLILGILSVLGGFFMIFLSIQNFRFQLVSYETTSDYRRSILYGIVTNVLSPHPYIFWITIGGPTFIRASNVSGVHAAYFICGFYILLVGSKIWIAYVSGKMKGFIQSILYKRIMYFLGIILLILSFYMIFQGVQLMMIDA